MTLALFHPAFKTLGGAEVLVATQAKYFRQTVHEVCVVTLAYDEKIWNKWLTDIAVRIVPPAPIFDAVLNPVSKLRRTAARAERCLIDCSAVLACNYPSNLLLGATAVPAKKVWSCTEPARDLHLDGANPTMSARFRKHPHGTSEVERYFAQRLEANERALKRRNKGALIAYDIEQTCKIESIFAISEFSRESIRRIYGRTDVGVIYPIVRFPSCVTSRRSGLERQGLQILTHSRLEIVKNIDNIIRGFAIYAGSNPDSRLHIVGDGQAKERLVELRDSLGLHESVIFHGYVTNEELDAIYAHCDVFALQPLDEPFGMVFPEAAARGLLLVGSDHGGPMEIMDGGSLGWACDPYSPEAVADAFSQIESLSDGEVDTRRQIADQACRNRYSEEIIGPLLLRAVT